jgi:PAS domain S-box-containing protein
MNVGINSLNTKEKNGRTEAEYQAEVRAMIDTDDWAFVTELLDSIPFYVIIIDETHHIITANKAVRKVLGVDPDAVVGMYCPKAVHGLGGPYPGCPLEEAAKNNRSVVKQMYFSENKMWAKSAAYLTNKLTKDGKRIFIHTVQDITKRKQAEEKLKNNIEELEKWQRLTVGREEKMIELKNEIKELKKKLKNYKSI